METRNRRLGPWDSLGSIIDAIDGLENTNVKCTWFESVGSGLSGTITPPSGSTILLDEWSAGIDVLVSKIDTGVPTFEPVLDDEGTIVTGTLDAAGNWTISGTPGDGYPISLIYVYRVALENLNSIYCLSAAQLEGVNTLSLLGGLGDELTGFPDDYRDESTIAINSLDFTITPVGGKFSVWVLGKEFVYTSVETQVLDGTEGIHWVYFDSDGAIQVAVNPNETAEEDLIKRNALIAYIMLDDNDTHIVFADERHGLTMDGSTHFYLHEINGFTYYEGLTAGDITSDGSGNENASATLSITDGTLFDEDIKYETVNSGQTLSTPAQIPIYYMDGVAGSWRKDTADNYPVKTFPTDTQLLAYNSFDSPNYEQTEAGNNDFVLCHIFAVNDIDEPIIAIQGQATYATIILAREGATVELLNLSTIGLPAQEFTPLYTLIYQTATAYSNDVQARIRTTDDGDDYIDWRTTQASSGSGGGGSGDVTGPGSSTDDAIALFDGVTGTVIKEGNLFATAAGISIGDGAAVAATIGFTDDDLYITNNDPDGLVIITAEKSATGQSTLFSGDPDGSVELYHDNVKTFNTVATGIEVTDGTSIGQLLYSGTTLLFNNTSHGAPVEIKGEKAAGTGVTLFHADPDTYCRLYYSGLLSLETTADGMILHNAGATHTWFNKSGSEIQMHALQNSVTLGLKSKTSVGGNVYMFKGDPDGSAELYYAGALSMKTVAGGFNIYDDDGDNPLMSFNGSGGARQGYIQFHTGGTLQIYDNIGVKNILIYNPGTSVELYYAGVKTMSSVGGGLSVWDSANEGQLFQAGSVTYLWNYVHGGNVSIIGENTATGAAKSLFIGDPDGAVELYYAGVKTIETITKGVKVHGYVEIEKLPADDTGSGMAFTADVDTNTVGIGGILLLGADGSYDDADASAEATAAGMVVMATAAGTGSMLLLQKGTFQDAGAWDWTPGAILYLSETEGELTETAPVTSEAIVRIMGYALTADSIFFDPDKTYIEV
jgi:hypothetical protein